MRASPFAASLLLVLSSSWAHAELKPATPSNYQQVFDTLKAGDTLQLAAGSYTDGLWISDLHGSEAAPIIIEGPADLGAVFEGSEGTNTVDIRDASYIVLRRLQFDGKQAYVDAIKAGGNDSQQLTHHITVEGCYIHNYGDGAEKQIVGISTKLVSWDWVVRGNIIEAVGTGMYFGNSDGSSAFIGGLIEGNLITGTVGYSMQIKHQLDRTTPLSGNAAAQVPTDDRVVIIRHNVFVKSGTAASGDERPNLLLSGPPDSGAGSNDRYEIYGNLFFHNNDDSLLQASGRLHIHDNIFVDSAHNAIRLASHNNKAVLEALIYNNTIFDTNRGINLASAVTGASLVAGNAVFTAEPLSGNITTSYDNVTDSTAAASNFVNNPSKTLGQMDFYPSAGSALKGSVVDLAATSSDVDSDRDFNGALKDFSYRGAYHGEGTNPGWPLDNKTKPLPSTSSSSTSSTSSSGAGGSSSSSGTGGAGASSSSSSGAGSSGGDGDEGCGCALPGRSAPGQASWLLLLLGLGAVARRVVS